MTLSVYFAYQYFVEELGGEGFLGHRMANNYPDGERTFQSSENSVGTDGDPEVEREQFNLGEALVAVDFRGATPWIYVGKSSEGIYVLWGAGTYFFSNNPDLANTTQPYEMANYEATCFLEGVRIACEDGERAVETLSIGDRVRLADGSFAPIRWIGRQPWVTLFADPLSVLPVRIAAGALAEGAPSRDLYLSPDHAVLVGDVLVHAGALVNGTTITRMTRRELPERFTYFHIELEAHAVVLAEGAPCESFVPNVSRARFENVAEYLAMFGEEQEMDELAYPRAASARQIPPSIRTVIAQRADALGPDLAAA